MLRVRILSVNFLRNGLLRKKLRKAKRRLIESAPTVCYYQFNISKLYEIIMDKIFHFDASADPYVADAAVLSCFDERIRQTVNKFLKRRGILRPDMIVVAGGAKTLASPRNDCERDFVLEQLRMSILLHNVRRVLLMSHSDCGACGGLAAFGGDPARESAHHRMELGRARDLVRARFPEIPVQGFFVNFEGVFAADAEGVGQTA